MNRFKPFIDWLTGKRAALKIALLNGLFLNILYQISKERLLLRSSYYIPNLYVMGLTVLTFIVVRMIKRRYNGHRDFSKIVLLAVLVLSGYHYVTYFWRSLSHLTHQEIRKSIAQKVVPTDFIGYGYTITDLRRDEYDYLSSHNNMFHKLPKNADYISCYYWYEGFLPDYTFELKYRVPLNEPIEEFDKSKEDKQWIYKRTVSYDEKGRKWVTYIENQW
jgi:hypothetical protein